MDFLFRALGKHLDEIGANVRIDLLLLGTARILRKPLRVKATGCNPTRGVTSTKENVIFLLHAMIRWNNNTLKKKELTLASWSCASATWSSNCRCWLSAASLFVTNCFWSWTSSASLSSCKTVNYSMETSHTDYYKSVVHVKPGSYLWMRMWYQFWHHKYQWVIRNS